MLEKYDVNIFTESKIDDLDVLKLPNNYIYHSQNRKKYNKKSGGITVVYRSSLKLNVIETESDFVLWLKLDIAHENFSCLFLGCIYIPPEGSNYSSPDAFEEIENEFITLNNDLH